jgi:EmrB/QacA subfamily drug resistance transporter
MEAEGQVTHRDDSGAEHAFLSHEQILVVVIGLLAGMLLAALDQSIVNVALPQIVSDLGGLNHLSWVVTAYLLTSTAVTPLWGKISDLYGRRVIFQAAITIFLIGSALCGIAQDLPQLIAFRALQGIGGGGLFAIAFAIIGDIIPPRDRGRYQGYFGAVFGLSSVAGPLLGGWLTDAISWRWIFYINLPVGIAALIITSLALKIPVQRREHSIDYLGATLIVASVSSLLLYLNWAGERYGWQSAGPVALLLLSFALAGLFVYIEMHAREPIIPMRLFRNSVFSIGTAYSFLVGIAMFGALVFLPLFFQAVKGMSPTNSGLATVPSVFGIVTASILSGQIISRTGRYKIFPILGSTIFAIALLCMSTIGRDTPYVVIAIFAFFVGGGLGLTMQTITTAVQNSVDFRDMGAATSSVTFSRSLGGSIGTAFLGAIFGTTLARTLREDLAVTGNTSVASINANDIDAIHALTEPVKGIVLDSYSHAIDTIFLWSAPFAILAFFLSFGLKELRLRTGREDTTARVGASPDLIAADD